MMRKNRFGCRISQYGRQKSKMADILAKYSYAKFFVVFGIKIYVFVVVDVESGHVGSHRAIYCTEKTNSLNTGVNYCKRRE